ncbi:MAG: glycosyltransferase family 39 protein [Planctomycetaceae bacterium]|nr:glycosyltransferase family 39 protein [Planctomycetales bacterium]MCB9924584.1 glycosyltransferase family 39 protein [Planctomycetaceae bacterium]
MARWISWMLLVAIITVAVVLRLHGISQHSLWLDEALSWKLQSFPLELMLERTGEPTTTHPPLYFLLLHFWTRTFGDSDTAMRSLSVVASITTIPAMYVLVKSLDAAFGTKERERSTTAGFVACGFLAVSNLHIHHAQQVRGYALAGLLTVLSSISLVRALTKRERAWIDWCTYTMSVVALCYTHNLGLFTACAQQLFVAFYLWGPESRTRFRTGDEQSPGLDSARDALGTSSTACDAVASKNSIALLKAKRVGALLALGGLAIGYLPWITRTLGQSQKLRSSWQRPIGFDDIAAEVGDAITGTSAQLQTGSSVVSWIIVVGIVIVWGLLVCRCGWAGVFLALLGAVPTGLILAYSLNSPRSIFDARYLTFAQIAWLLGTAWLLSRTPGRIERILLALIPLSWCCFWCFEVHMSHAAIAEPGMRGALAHVTRHRQADEIVVAETPFVLFGAQHYAREHFSVRLCADRKDRFLFNGESQLLATDLITHRDIAAESPRGIWLLTSSSYMSNAKNQFPASCLVPKAAWQLQSSIKFRQDLYWEHAIRVHHYVWRDVLETTTDSTVLFPLPVDD